MVVQPLSKTSRYKEVDGILRRAALGCATFVAVHTISEPIPTPEQYCEVHEHAFAELNLILGEPAELVYEIKVRGESFTIESPTTVWIPPHTPHSANYVEGTGTFAAIYMREPQSGEFPV